MHFYAIFQFLGSSGLIFHYLPATGKEKRDTTEGPLEGQEFRSVSHQPWPREVVLFVALTHI